MKSSSYKIERKVKESSENNGVEDNGIISVG